MKGFQLEQSREFPIIPRSGKQPRTLRSHRLEAQDIALSRLVHRFESGWERQLNQRLTFTELALYVAAERDLLSPRGAKDTQLSA
jgi:hypothetical protein